MTQLHSEYAATEPADTARSVAIGLAGFAGILLSLTAVGPARSGGDFQLTTGMVVAGLAFVVIVALLGRGIVAALDEVAGAGRSLVPWVVGCGMLCAAVPLAVVVLRQPLLAIPAPAVVGAGVTLVALSAVMTLRALRSSPAAGLAQPGSTRLLAWLPIVLDAVVVLGVVSYLFWPR